VTWTGRLPPLPPHLLPRRQPLRGISPKRFFCGTRLRLEQAERTAYVGRSEGSTDLLAGMVKA
jgi:hypothetical protein